MNPARHLAPLALYALAALPSAAKADDGSIDVMPHAAREFVASRGNASIVFAQELWHLWGLDSSGLVERTLRSAAHDPARDRPLTPVAAA